MSCNTVFTNRSSFVSCAGPIEFFMRSPQLIWRLKRLYSRRRVFSGVLKMSFVPWRIAVIIYLAEVLQTNKHGRTCLFDHWASSKTLVQLLKMTGAEMRPNKLYSRQKQQHKSGKFSWLNVQKKIRLCSLRVAD